MCTWATLCGICAENKSDMENQYRLYNGRGFLGNQVIDPHHDAATFQDLGRLPATLEAAKAADFYGCLPGHVS